MRLLSFAGARLLLLQRGVLLQQEQIQQQQTQQQQQQQQQIPFLALLLPDPNCLAAQLMNICCGVYTALKAQKQQKCCWRCL